MLTKDMPYLVDTKGCMDTEIAVLCSNSREKAENGLFFCIPGARFDAHDYAPQAVTNGCTALVVDHFLELDVPQVKVTNVRAAMSRMAAAFFGHPAQQLRLVGVTGTKGKTTTTYMIKTILERAGHKCGLIGTTGNMIGDKRIASNYTTPDPIDLQRDLAASPVRGQQQLLGLLDAQPGQVFRECLPAFLGEHR
jgi:UDP-N-acetylmuramoyl-L-alanyl-D-glutamate--2,6-diaminopimelate ligase